MKRVLLLNPPGSRLYIREYYCSKVSQADNLLHPIDLVILSGILSQEHEVSFIDAIANNLSPDRALAQVVEYRPEAIVCLFGSVSLHEDFPWISRVKEALPETLIIGSGDIFMEKGAKYLDEHLFLDAVCLDFTSDDISSYLCGCTSGLSNMIVRDPDGSIVYPEAGCRKKYFEVPIPRHDIFHQYHYRHSMIREKKFATTIIDYGCPYPCSFCIMNKLGYKVRTVDNVMTELEYIKKLGLREIFFHTQTFGANKKVARQLCEAMIKAELGFGWVCFSRVDVTTPDFLDLMQKAGCHSIIYGVESGSDKILRKYNKGYNINQIMKTIDYCRQIGIETSGTFILGLPEEDHDTIRQTLDLLRRIKLDYAGINVAVPRVGTDLRAEAVYSRLIPEDFNVMDQSGTTIAMPTKHLTKKDLARYRKQAIRTFYFRSSYIFRRLSKMRVRDFLKTLKNFVGLVRSTWLSSILDEED